MPKPACIHQRFEAQARRTPDAVAVVFGEQALTYRELNRRANGVASRLLGLGIKPDTPVGLYAERSLALLPCILGILKAGAAYVPFDPQYPRERLSFMISDGRLPFILTPRTLAPGALPEHQVPILNMEELEWSAVDENPATAVAPHHLAYVVYTSGSTGNPKGVMVTHANVTGIFDGMESVIPIQADDVWTFFHSPAFAVSVWEIWGALFHGCKLVVVPSEITRAPEGFYDLLRDEKVTILTQTPGFFRQVIQTEEARPQANRLAVRKILLTGEPLKTHLLKPWFERHGDAHPQVYNMYGMSETTLYVTFRPLSLRDLKGGNVIGLPVPGVGVHLLDEAHREVPEGVPGEIHLSGPGVARGYLNRPELTAERFLPNPADPKSTERWYRSGDLARRLPNGELEHLGRGDHQVKIRGFRVELGEIEAAIAGFEGVAQTVVIAREYDSGDQRLIAYLVPRRGTVLLPKVLRAFLREKLPSYMVPAAFVMLETLPLNAHGKLDTRALPVPDRESLVAEKETIWPRTPQEAAIAAIWRELLQVDRIGVEDDFFDLGGNSLLAASLFVRIQETTGCNLPLATLFQTPTIAQLANLIREGGWEPLWASLVPIRPGGSKPPLFLVHPVGGNVLRYRDLANHLPPDLPVFALQAIGLDGTQRPYDCVETMAAHYLQEIQAVHPHGPYLLAGYSSGGTVAFEMAQQLRAKGEAVELLALFDTYASAQKKPLGTRAAAHARILLHAPPGEKLAYMREKLAAARRAFDDAARRLFHAAVPGLQTPSEKVEAANFRAFSKYRPAFYPGDVLVFRAKDRYRFWEELQYQADEGWRSLVGGGLTVVDLSGNHDQVLDEPNASLIACKLWECIDAVLEPVEAV